MKKEVLKYLAIFFEMGTVIFLVAGLFLMFRTFKYVEVEGIVTRVGNEKTVLGFRNDYLVIEYNVKGEDYKYYRSTNLFNNKKIGDSYKILYDKNDPNIMRADYHMILFYELGLFSLIMALFMNYFKNEED